MAHLNACLTIFGQPYMGINDDQGLFDVDKETSYATPQGNTITLTFSVDNFNAALATPTAEHSRDFHTVVDVAELQKEAK